MTFYIDEYKKYVEREVDRKTNSPVLKNVFFAFGLIMTDSDAASLKEHFIKTYSQVEMKKCQKCSNSEWEIIITW